MTQPIIPPFPQLPANLINFKVMVITDGVVVHHDCGITDTSIKELFSLGEDGALHPDLVTAAMTSIQSMAAKYNGVNNEERQQVSPEADSQASTEAELRSGAAEAGNANEEARQVDPTTVA
jgi:hypothetical protein